MWIGDLFHEATIIMYEENYKKYYNEVISSRNFFLSYDPLKIIRQIQRVNESFNGPFLQKHQRTFR